jgi:hypothetical protein
VELSALAAYLNLFSFSNIPETSMILKIKIALPRATAVILSIPGSGADGDGPDDLLQGLEIGAVGSCG